MRRAVLQGGWAAVGRLHVVAFDWLELAGDDLRALPWVKRRERLRDVFAVGERLGVVRTRPASVGAHERLVAVGFEGSVLKRPGSTYRPGRQATWRKYTATLRAIATHLARCAEGAMATRMRSVISMAGV